VLNVLIFLKLSDVERPAFSASYVNLNWPEYTKYKLKQDESKDEILVKTINNPPTSPSITKI